MTNNSCYCAKTFSCEGLHSLYPLLCVPLGPAAKLLALDNASLYLSSSISFFLQLIALS